MLFVKGIDYPQNHKEGVVRNIGLLCLTLINAYLFFASRKSLNSKQKETNTNPTDFYQFRRIFYILNSDVSNSQCSKT